MKRMTMKTEEAGKRDHRHQGRERQTGHKTDSSNLGQQQEGTKKLANSSTQGPQAGWQMLQKATKEKEDKTRRGTRSATELLEGIKKLPTDPTLAHQARWQMLGKAIKNPNRDNLIATNRQRGGHLAAGLEGR